MDVTPTIPDGKYVMEAYGNEGFTLNGVRHEGSILIAADRVLPWQPVNYESIQPEHFQPLLDVNPLPEIVIIGCGPDFKPMPEKWKATFRAKTVPVEMMDTGAACRTYNILLAEGRRVGAAFIAV